MNRLMLSVCTLALASLSAGVFGETGTNTDELIEAVKQAYGGDALMNISNYSITERYTAPATGQS
jgi:hypothetical protein